MWASLLGARRTEKHPALKRRDAGQGLRKDSGYEMITWLKRTHLGVWIHRVKRRGRGFVIGEALSFIEAHLLRLTPKNAAHNRRQRAILKRYREETQTRAAHPQKTDMLSK